MSTLIRGGGAMSIIDKQRIAAVAALEALSYTFSLADGWTPPATNDAAASLPSTAESDTMHALLMQRADALAGRTEGSPEEAELKVIADALQAYEAKRWPNGKDAGGKG
jgi:hypothetical protein